MKKIIPSSILVNNMPDAFSEISLIRVGIELIYLEYAWQKCTKQNAGSAHKIMQTKR